MYVRSHWRALAKSARQRDEKAPPKRMPFRSPWTHLSPPFDCCLIKAALPCGPGGAALPGGALLPRAHAKEMRKNRPSECRLALLGPIFHRSLTAALSRQRYLAAPAVQRYLAAPAEAILALPIKNQKSKFNNRHSVISLQLTSAAIRRETGSSETQCPTLPHAASSSISFLGCPRRGDRS